MNKYKHLSKEIRNERIKIKGCIDKKQFDTEKEAYQKGQDSYKCKHCGKWHRSGRLSKLISTIKKNNI
jgi:transposase-like protein